MIGVVMAGGRGSRMSDSSLGQCSEKLLYAQCEKKPLVVHVIDALCNSICIDKIFVIASCTNAPATFKMLQTTYCHNDSIVTVMNSKGAGYSQDLQDALCIISHKMSENSKNNEDSGALVVSGDMPFLDPGVILNITTHYAKNMWTCIVISESYAQKWDTSFDYQTMVQDCDEMCYYTGISLVDLNHVNLSSESKALQQRHVIFDDHRIATSINTMQDYERFLARFEKPK